METFKFNGVQTNFEESMFERLLSLPLFQGLSTEELLRIIECAKFEFSSEFKYEVLLRQGESLSKLTFLLQGEVIFEKICNDGLKVVEYYTAPYVFFPQCLFGKRAKSDYTVISNTDVTILEVSKQEVQSQLMKFYVFRLSMLNFICSMAEVSERPLCVNDSLENRIVWELCQLFYSKVGRKEVHVGMKQLANRVNASRLGVSKALHALEEKGFLKLSREKIEIPFAERLLEKIF